MGIEKHGWQPRSSQSWAELLGMIHVPLFGPTRATPVPGDNAVLLDGPRASFAIFSARRGGARLATAGDVLSWSWSAYVRHAVIIDEDLQRMFVRRWDAPSFLGQFDWPEPALAAEELLTLFERSRAPEAPDVVQHVLEAFRVLRQALPDGSALDALRLLNGFLLLADAVARGQVQKADALAVRAFGDILARLPSEERAAAELGELDRKTLRGPAGVLPSRFLEPEPRTGCQLDSYLLLRHAASQLYQEAHLEWERGTQSYLPGFAPEAGPRGRLVRDVRYTPPNLARALVQQALSALAIAPGQRQPLTVLDPACGSSIFHRECLRELGQRGQRTRLRLFGYDTSPAAVYLSRFSLVRARADLHKSAQDVDVDIRQADALAVPWEQADLVLMNPPFVPWPRLSSDQQGQLKECLGSLFFGRPDLSMAFLLKGIEHLKPGGVLASVIPAAMLSSRSGEALRERLSQEAELLLLGRFEGYRYFTESIVEPAFVVLRKKSAAAARPQPVKVLIAEEGAEDAALRLLRSPGPGRAPEERVEIYAADPSEFSASSWLPPRDSTRKLRDLLSRLELPCVNDLFCVRLGVRTGNRAAFVLSADEWRGLPRGERSYFRPMAGQGTIHGGRLEPLYYLFYPYSTDGLTLRTEGELREHVPTFCRLWLLPHKEALVARKRAKHWWELAEKRGWQLVKERKLVSTSFASPGSFAYDATGDYIVVQGYAWLWKPKVAPQGVHRTQAQPDETDLPWAYLALLNSAIAFRLFRCFCPQVQGGQVDLSSRHVNQVPVPDLTGEEAAAMGLVQDLARLGRLIHAGRFEELAQDLNRLSARAYRLPETL